MDSSTYKYVCSTRTEVTSTLSRHKYDLSIFTVSILRTKQQWVTSGQQPHRNDVVALMVMVIVGSCFGNVFGVFVFENLLIPSRFHNLLFLCSETITSHSYINIIQSCLSEDIECFAPAKAQKWFLRARTINNATV